MQVSVDLSAHWPLQLLSCSFDNNLAFPMTGTIILCLRDGQHGKYRDHPKGQKIHEQTKLKHTVLTSKIWRYSNYSAITNDFKWLTKKKKTVTSSASLLLGPCLGLCRWPQAAHIWQQLDYQDFRSATSRLRGRPLGVRNLRRRPRSTASLGLGLCPCSSGFSGANAQFRQAESALTKHAKFDKKSLHFFKAEWLLDSIYIPSTMRKGMLKTRFLHLLPRLQLYIHDTWSHLRLHWNRIPPPSHMKFVRSRVLWCHCVEQHPPGGIEDESFMGPEIKRKTMTRFMPSVIKVLREGKFEIVAKDIERISQNVMQMVRFRTFKLDSLHHF